MTENKPSISFAGDKPRSLTIDLEWPLQLADGRKLEVISLRRLTGGEVATLQTRLMEAEGRDEVMIAAFSDEPAEVIMALDQDDYMAVKAAAFDFLPRRLRQAIEAQAAEADTGEV